MNTNSYAGLMDNFIGKMAIGQNASRLANPADRFSCTGRAACTMPIPPRGGKLS
jgi:hypothetical protein